MSKLRKYGTEGPLSSSLPHPILPPHPLFHPHRISSRYFLHIPIHPLPRALPTRNLDARKKMSSIFELSRGFAREGGIPGYKSAVQAPGSCDPYYAPSDQSIAGPRQRQCPPRCRRGISHLRRRCRFSFVADRGDVEPLLEGFYLLPVSQPDKTKFSGGFLGRELRRCEVVERAYKP